MDFLKEIYGQEALTYDRFCEKVNAAENITIANIASGDYVKKTDFDETNRQLSEANEKLKGYDPEWQTKIATAKADAQKELSDYKFGVELSKALSAANVVDEVSIKANLNMDSIKLNDNGKLEGLDDQIAALKESKPFLFTQPRIENLGGPTPGGDQKTVETLKDALEEHYAE